MSELATRDYYDPTPVRWSTTRQLKRIQQQSLISQAAIEAREQDAAFLVAQRINNGYKLAAHTIQNATQLNHLVTLVTRDNPGLEVELRGIEQTVAVGAQAIIHGYMTRP